MNSAVLGLLGVYLAMTAYHKNGDVLLQYLSSEGQFVSWIVVIMILAALASWSETHDFVAPFITLAIVATIVTRFDDVQNQIRESYAVLTN